VRRVLIALALGAALALPACSQREGAPPPPVVVPSEEYQAPPVVAEVQPIALRIPSIKLDAREWVKVGIGAKRQIEVPSVKKPRLLGWFCPDKPECGAPIPGETGPAVIVGHINGNGQDGVFANLHKVKVGDRVEVERNDGYTAVFEITLVQILPKSKFPTDAVYGNTPTPQLRLITCGPFDLDTKARSYRDQTIAYGGFLQLRPTELTPAIPGGG